MAVAPEMRQREHDGEKAGDGVNTGQNTAPCPLEPQRETGHDADGCGHSEQSIEPGKRPFGVSGPSPSGAGDPSPTGSEVHPNHRKQDDAYPRMEVVVRALPGDELSEKPNKQGGIENDPEETVA